MAFCKIVGMIHVTGWIRKSREWILNSLIGVAFPVPSVIFCNWIVLSTVNKKLTADNGRDHHVGSMGLCWRCAVF